MTPPRRSAPSTTLAASLGRLCVSGGGRSGRGEHVRGRGGGAAMVRDAGAAAGDGRFGCVWSVAVGSKAPTFGRGFAFGKDEFENPGKFCFRAQTGLRCQEKVRSQQHLPGC